MDYSTLHTRQLLKKYREFKNECFELEYHLSEDHEDEEVIGMRKQLALMKKELDGRENILTKPELKAIRQQKAKKHKGGRRSHKKK
jgi:hypothetical protein